MMKSKVRVQTPLYGQVVVGPPGSGKTTFCNRSQIFFEDLGRKICIINLDPGNENLEYTAALDIMKLITVDEVMSTMVLGPNGALMFCMKYLEKNVDNWFLPELRKLTSSYNYFIFDCPGQIELYTHNTSIANIFARLAADGFNLVTLNLIDAHYCSDPHKFVSTLLVALNSMLRIALPHINVLSKADLLKQNESKLCFSLDFYTDVLDLKYLLDAMEDLPSMKKHRKLITSICSLIQDYSLVSFQLLDSRSLHSLIRLRNLIDKANGFAYAAGEQHSINTMLVCAAGAEPDSSRFENDIEPYMQANPNMV